MTEGVLLQKLVDSIENAYSIDKEHPFYINRLDIVAIEGGACEFATDLLGVDQALIQLHQEMSWWMSEMTLLKPESVFAPCLVDDWISGPIRPFIKRRTCAYKNGSLILQYAINMWKDGKTRVSVQCVAYQEC